MQHFLSPQSAGTIANMVHAGLNLVVLCVLSAMLVFTQVAAQATFYWWCPSTPMMVNALLMQPCQAAG